MHLPKMQQPAAGGSQALVVPGAVHALYSLLTHLRKGLALSSFSQSKATSLQRKPVPQRVPSKKISKEDTEALDEGGS